MLDGPAEVEGLILNSFHIQMSCPNLRKISPLYKIILAAVLLLISYATTTNGNGSSISELYDNAIREFVEQSAEPESTSSSSSNGSDQQQFNLTYKNAALILKEIEEKVADKLIVAESQGQHIELGSFYGALGEMHKALHHKEIQWKRERNARFQPLFAVDESSPSEDLRRANAELFHRLLTFAIRMGFHIGHKELNGALLMHEGKSQKVDLSKFVRAQNAFEKMHTEFVQSYQEKRGIRWNFWDDIRTLSHRVWFDTAPLMPNEKLLTLNFKPPSEPWNHSAIEQNLTTIKWLHAVELTIDGWVHLLGRIQNMHLLESCYMDSSNKAQNVLLKLMRSWSGDARIITHHFVSTIEYCAAKKFAMNLLERLNGVNEVNTYLARNQGASKKLAKFSEWMTTQYDHVCSYQRLLENGNENIKNEKEYKVTEQLMISTEPFMHYEDAILFNKLRTDQEVKMEEAKNFVMPILVKWQEEIGECKITKDHMGNISVIGKNLVTETECDFNKISQDMIGIKHNVEPNINAAFGILSLSVQWQNFLKRFHDLVQEINTAKGNIRFEQNKRQRVRDIAKLKYVVTDFETQKRAAIDALESEVKMKFNEQKARILRDLTDLIKAIADRQADAAKY